MDEEKPKEELSSVGRGFALYGNKKGVGHNVEVDVFKVSQDTFNKIDRLEGHQVVQKRVGGHKY